MPLCSARVQASFLGAGPPSRCSPGEEMQAALGPGEGDPSWSPQALSSALAAYSWASVLSPAEIFPKSPWKDVLQEDPVQQGPES